MLCSAARIFSTVMRESSDTSSPLYENLDTSYVNLAELLRYLQRQNFAGRVRVELDEYDADVWLRPGLKPQVQERDRSMGRVAEGEGALQRLLVRATDPGGSISVYTETEEKFESALVERTRAETFHRPDFGAESYGDAQAEEDFREEEEWQDLLRASGDLIAAVERACLSAGADFPAIFREISFELSDDYPFLDRSVTGFDYSHGAVEIVGRHNKSAILGGIVEVLRRTVNRVATGGRERNVRERVALELAVLARRREAALARFQLLQQLDRIAGTRVV
ncbi:MAG: hypothetical protein AUG51_22325 [Acidobacteria bacterium 13_1_20CM_3_53_8]|nr:MAG: hypothetical protein AUG51_22325 [Acidobacteria bacterium 13_1_20CM_3_53_8]